MTRLLRPWLAFAFALPALSRAEESASLSFSLPGVAIDLSDIAAHAQAMFLSTQSAAILLALLPGYWILGYRRGGDEAPGDRLARRILLAWSLVGVFAFLGAAALLHRAVYWMSVQAG